MSKQWDHHRVWYSYHGEGWFTCYECGESIWLKWVNGHYDSRWKYVIHHYDENRSNNCISNLVVMHWDCHSRLHQTGKKASPETIERLRLSHLGKSPTEATRVKLSKALKGKPWTEARRKAGMSAWGVGVPKR